MNSRNQSCNLEEEKATKIPHEEEKKKVRRKRQRRKLYYKQIPMNMAEARREIVTALKLHRANHKKQFKQSIIPQFRITNPTIYPHFVPQTPPILHIPTQTLGLKLSFDDHFNTNSSYFCSPVSVSTHQKLPRLDLFNEEQGNLMDFDLVGESGKQIQDGLEIDDDHNLFGFHNVQTQKGIDFPDWLSMNDDLLQHHHSNFQDSLQHPDLSCLEIGEIEDVDGDWLA